MDFVSIKKNTQSEGQGTPPTNGTIIAEGATLSSHCDVCGDIHLVKKHLKASTDLCPPDSLLEKGGICSVCDSHVLETLDGDDPISDDDDGYSVSSFGVLGQKQRGSLQDHAHHNHWFHPYIWRYCLVRCRLYKVYSLESSSEFHRPCHPIQKNPIFLPIMFENQPPKVTYTNNIMYSCVIYTYPLLDLKKNEWLEKESSRRG
jgi:hypothetical protein